MASEIQIWIEKGSGSLESGSLESWERALGSFSNMKYYIYDSDTILQTSGYITNLFTSSYASSDTFHISYSKDQIVGNLDNAYMTWDGDIKLSESIDSSKYYRLMISSSNNDNILFNPSTFTIPLKWELDIDNSYLSASITPYISPKDGNFWSFNTSSIIDTGSFETSSITLYNQLVLESSLGNKYYVSGGFSQANIPYIPSFNSRFNGGYEPEGTGFPNIIDEWKLEIGDQIRFENNEALTFNLINVELSGSSPNEKVLITLDRNIPTGSNLNFFLIRRWKENRNNISINKTFPYSQKLISTLLAPTTTGFILPKYPTDEIGKNPDKIIRDLIDKKIIE